MTPINPIWGYVAGGFIVTMMVTFIAIWIWAWRKKRQPNFSRMAQLPLEDDPSDIVDTKETHS